MYCNTASPELLTIPHYQHSRTILLGCTDLMTMPERTVSIVATVNHQRKRLRFKERSKTSHSSGSDLRKRKGVRHSEISPDTTAFTIPTLSPGAAFRESLLDALADNEGAAYWESVYGQPIHTYSRYGPEGGRTFECLNDDDYAAYVRRRIWEQSRDFVEVQRARQLRERTKGRARERWRLEAERAREERWPGEKAHAKTVEREPKLGLGRLGYDPAEGGLKEYQQQWQVLADALKSRTNLGRPVCAQVPWPVATSKACDITQSAVEGFLRAYANFSSKIAPGDDEDHLLSVVKRERYRYHPDKFAQWLTLFGASRNEDTLKSATLVFQIVDRFWNEKISQKQ